MAEKVNVKYVGPRMAILAGRAIYHGEAREVTQAQLEHARKTHPKGFVIVGEEDEPKAAPESRPEGAPDLATALANSTVDEIVEGVAMIEDLDYLRQCLEAEQAGKGRKTAIAAFVDRITELETAAPSSDDDDSNEGGEGEASDEKPS